MKRIKFVIGFSSNWMTQVDVLILDKYTLVRESIKLLLSEIPVVKSVIDCSTLTEMKALITETTYDLVIIARDTTQSVDQDFVVNIKKTLPNIPIMIVSSEDNPNPAIINSFFNIGIAAFIPNTATPDVLEDAINAIHIGQTYRPMTELSQSV